MVGWGAGGGRVHTQFHASGSGLAVALLALHPHGLAFWLFSSTIHQSRPLTTPATVAAPAVLAAGRKILDANAYTYLPSEAPP